MSANPGLNMSSHAELEKVIRGFRVSELQTLLHYAGKNKVGKKPELQSRALSLVVDKRISPSIEKKILELDRRRNGESPRGYSHGMDPYPKPHAPNAMNYGHNRPPIPPIPAGSSHSRQQDYLLSGRHQNNIPATSGHPDARNYPVHPNVTFKDLPFYDQLGELIKPTTLYGHPGSCTAKQRFTFFFTPHQLSMMENDPDVLVQFRLCNFDSSCDQDDEIPQSCAVRVNGYSATLPAPIPTNKPNTEPKRQKRPLDIIGLVRRTVTEPNEIIVWFSTFQKKAFVCAAYLVKKLNSVILIQRLRANGMRNPDHTTAMIKEKLCQDRDSEIATMSLKGSLLCPLGKTRMQLPCRASTCSHLACFDATLYLQMNEKKPKWLCPVCDKPAYFKDLNIDGLFLHIVGEADADCTEVQFADDGKWKPVVNLKKGETSKPFAPFVAQGIPKAPSSEVKKVVDVVDLDSDSDTEVSCKPPKKVLKTSNVIPFLESIDNSSPAESLSKALDVFPSKTSKSEMDPQSFDSYNNCLPALTPALQVSSTSTTKFENDALVPTDPTTSAATFPESPDVIKKSSPTSESANIDLFSFIQPFDEDSNSSSPTEIDEEKSPDIINID